MRIPSLFCVALLVGASWLTLSALRGNEPQVPADPKQGGSKQAAASDSPQAKLVQTLGREINAALAQRGQDKVLDAYVAYAGKLLDDSTGDKSFRDKTGNCRLATVDWQLRHPVEAVADAEQFTATMHRYVRDPGESLATSVRVAAQKMGFEPADKSAGSDKPPTAIEIVTRALAEADAQIARMLAPLTAAEQAELAELLYPVSTRDIESGAFFADPKQGRRACDLLEKLDRTALCSAAEALAELARPGGQNPFWTAGPKLDAPGAVEGVTGTAQAIPAGDGIIVLGGPEANTYRLDANLKIRAVIDLGGDDIYEEGSVGPQRRVLAIIDRAGNDTYRGKQPGIQGGAVLGAALLVDAAGNDRYEAEHVAQGACLGGAGLLVDLDGDDTYRGLRRVQGSAIAGIAFLCDRAGKDDYRAALLSQGVGGPLGFGLLADLTGDDHYFAGGLYPDGYEDTPGYDGWSQGVGAGPRGTANGGIGMLLEGAGDDVYECDYFSHGGGYWFAAGYLRDFAGNDRRLGPTRTMWDGSPRKEPIFLRWGIGYGCHYAAGYVFDDAGDDEWGGNIVGLGFSWDIAVAALCDFAGNDRYTAKEGATQGQAHQLGLAILFDAAGDDAYGGTQQGTAPANIEYHKLPVAGGNFSFAIDYGGTDQYEGQPGAKEAVEERGSPGGFLIRREKTP